MKRPKTLSATLVKTVSRPERYGDGRGGHGLTLLVKPTRIEGRWSKTWSQRVRIDGRETNLGLGSYPAVTLAEARQRALRNRQAIEEGRNPKARNAPSFQRTAETVINLRIPIWRDGGKSAKQWRASLQRYVYPLIGDKSVSDIDSGDVLRVLTPHWTRRTETMRRVKQRIGAVLAWAVAAGYRTDNPARRPVIDSALPRITGRQGQRALHHSKVAGVLAVIESSGAYHSTILATWFLTLTATRSGEARLARWPEFNLEQKYWTVPGSRTKTGKPHRIPLSEEALGILDEAWELSGGDGLVFPSVTGKPLSDSTISKLFRENNVGCVPHGMRSSFRDWCGESGVPREVAEQALAHTVKGIEGAYARSDLLEVRRPVMDEWGEYLKFGKGPL